MDNRAVFQCNACGEPFCQDGLHVDIHGAAVAHICPECLDNAKELQLTIRREGPGKPYEFRHFFVVDVVD